MPNLKHDFLESMNQPFRDEGFNVTLFRLFLKADKDNMLLLSLSFPEHYKIFMGWKTFGVDYSDAQLLAG